MFDTMFLNASIAESFSFPAVVVTFSFIDSQIPVAISLMLVNSVETFVFSPCISVVTTVLIPVQIRLAAFLSVVHDVRCFEKTPDVS